VLKLKNFFVTHFAFFLQSYGFFKTIKLCVSLLAIVAESGVHIFRNIVLLPFVQTNAAFVAGDEVALAGEEETAVSHSGGRQEVGMRPPACVKTVPANYQVLVIRKAKHLSVP
jgi:hypothetical protein